MVFKRATLVAVCCGTATLCTPATADQQTREVYDNYCGGCHEAGIGPVIAGMPAALNVWKARTSTGAMPRFTRTDISDEMLDAVARLIEASRPTTKGTDHAEAT
ncbi:MAG: cytochrome c [Spongiibacteraceae bacterium]|jgi:mono/diheme cytochrome c family protein|nr:cytochrome c [Spongiibacteraceae bacterium]